MLSNIYSVYKIAHRNFSVLPSNAKIRLRSRNFWGQYIFTSNTRWSTGIFVSFLAVQKIDGVQKFLRPSKFDIKYMLVQRNFCALPRSAKIRLGSKTVSRAVRSNNAINLQKYCSFKKRILFATRKPRGKKHTTRKSGTI